jgi:uncharacterized protein
MRRNKILILAALIAIASPLCVRAQQAGAPPVQGASPASAPGPGGAAAPARRGLRLIQVLIITGQSYLHDWITTTPVLKKELEDTGHFEVRVDDEFRGAGPETLAPYDVVVLNYSDGYGTNPELGWGDRANNALLDFVRSGKGLVVYHFSLSAFYNWPEYEKLTGCNWRTNNGHHSARHDFMIDVQDPDNPIMKGLRAFFPQYNDELYANLKCQPNTIHVLATAYDDHSLYALRPGDPQTPVGPGTNEPLLWTVNYGSGRVFVTALGHDASVMTSPGFITTLTRGTEWAAKGKVTILPSTEMLK